MIRLADVDENNFEALRRLDVAPEQRRFLDSPLGILARGYVYRTQRARVLAVLAEGEPVGLLLVKDMDEEPACYDLQQFMIDRRFQGRGYGAAALGLLLDRLRQEKKYADVEVCVHRENDAALALFEGAGFVDTDGKRRTLYGIKARRILLIFGNPDCTACKEIQETFTQYPELSAQIADGTLKVVDIYIDEDIELWKARKAAYPASWINGYDPTFSIRTDLIYNVRAVPSLYLLDENKTVLLKDAVPEKVLQALL